MSVRVSASVNFDAEDRAEAESIIADWKLHEGCQVNLMVMENVVLQTDEGGSVIPAPEPEAPVIEENGQPEERGEA